MGLDKKEADQLIDFIGTQASTGAESDSLDEKQELLEEIQSLCDPESTLIFNEDGTVEIEDEDDSPED
jgi:hypothetical protein